MSFPKPTLYVGLSGGPDSVALMHILKELESRKEVGRFDVVALHCNFHLRGEESDRDHRFCKELCQRIGVKLLVKEFDTFSYMREHHLSLEMAARELRYDWWNEVLSGSTNANHSPSLIALGHHQDDSIETALMNLMRGTGIQGLTGIVPYNAETHVIRPLLCLSRQEILVYLADNELTYVTDSTNRENDTLRNQVRNQLLPLMEQLLPQARQGIASTMSHLQESASLADAAVSHYVAEHAICHNTDGYTYYVLPADCPYPYQLRQHLLHMGYVLDGETARPIDQPLPHRPQYDAERTETFDQEQIHLPLRWRRWRQGDRMAPLGMDGHTKLLSDLFTNAHFLPIEKQLAWVLEDASGQILWVPGLRISHLARITPHTRHTITIHYGEVFDA